MLSRRHSAYLFPSALAGMPAMVRLGIAVAGVQLYGELLAAAWLNMHETGRTTQRIYGCYTVGATWTFVRADLEGLDTERPSLSVVSSPELSERLEAATIVKILKSIVRRHQQAA